jgi:cyclopropane-fatty-acyl-phospholipid synthase
MVSQETRRMIDSLLEKNLLPDRLIRFGIRRLLAQRIREETQPAPAARQAHLIGYVADLKTRPIAEDTRAANAQHYEVPTPFYQYCLGKRLKYSGCLYPTGAETLDQAEEAMLGLYAERARLADGQAILELGCGWGSLSLYMAEKFPRAKITGVSNSKTQKEFIDAEARNRGLSNLRIITCDMNVFDLAPGRFDRVVSIEMFEHMKNYQRLLANVAHWLKPGGLLFVHIFTHSRFAYHFVSRGPGDWMSRYFFTGGQMPSHDLLGHFQDDLKLLSDWKVNGTHYQRTAEHWLQNMDRHKAEILPLFADTYGRDQAVKWWAYWRVFYMSCAELWGYRGGEEWLVSHYLFQKP